MFSPRSLKFQITAALVSLVALFAVTVGYTVHALDEQRNDGLVLNLAGRLELAGERLVVQAMHYKENAPRDYQTYYRDLRLYYRDLVSHVRTYDRILGAFIAQRFDPALTGRPGPMRIHLKPRTQAAVRETKAVWDDYRDTLEERLGGDMNEPRLEWGAEYILENQDRLQDSTRRLLDATTAEIGAHSAAIRTISNLVLAVAAVLAGTIIVMFYLRVLEPLDRTMQAIRRVGQGEFGHQVRVPGGSEIADLATQLNMLSLRLNCIFRLIDRIERGGDLDTIVQLVMEEISGLIPADWIGVLVLENDRSTLKLERAFAAGQVMQTLPRRFALPGSTLGPMLASPAAPSYLPDIATPGSATQDDVFFRFLTGIHRHSAIVLPFSELNPVGGAIVFASRDTGAFSSDQVELLANIGHLITHSFGRTVAFLERARLAAIGQLASGIAHEIRSPLATIGMALDYIRNLDLPDRARVRVTLATGEHDRIGRLLEDILLYAKPMPLELDVLDVCEEIQRFIETSASQAQDRSQRLELSCSGGNLKVAMDRDRLAQILTNLTLNAVQAAPPDSVIRWTAGVDPAHDAIRLEVHNDGPPLSPAAMDRLFEPFFTTKTDGTGLGLSIVKRIVDAHGGTITIDSDAGSGTTVRITIYRQAA